MGTGFVKFPRWLLEEPYLSGLSGNEKILYSLIADRCELSKSTGKCDEDGKPFAVFTIKSIMLAIGCEKATAIKALDKLEGIGLIVRKKKHRQPSSIYLSESSLGSESEPSKVQKLNLLGSESEPNKVQKLNPIYTNTSYTDTRLISTRPAGTSDEEDVAKRAAALINANKEKCASRGRVGAGRFGTGVIRSLLGEQYAEPEILRAAKISLDWMELEANVKKSRPVQRAHERPRGQITCKAGREGEAVNTTTRPPGGAEGGEQEARP